LKKLLDWDDDYRNALDSLSDATSSAAAVLRRVPAPHPHATSLGAVRRRNAAANSGGGSGGAVQKSARRRKVPRQNSSHLMVTCRTSAGDSDTEDEAARRKEAYRRSWHAGVPVAMQKDATFVVNDVTGLLSDGLDVGPPDAKLAKTIVEAGNFNFVQ
jgi:hypothetical protein